MKLCQRFVGYSSSLMFALNVVLMLLPEFFFLRIFYTLYILYCMGSARTLHAGGREKERLKFAGITTVIILLTPAVIEFVLFMLMPGLRY